MMRGVSTWAVAVRKPDGEIEVSSEPLVSWAKRTPAPPLAGDPGGGGACGVAEDRLPRAGDLGQRADRARGGRGGATSRSAASPGALTIALSLVLAIGLFFVVPVGATSLIKDQLGSSVLFWLVEGCLRTAIFIGYLAADQPPQRPAAGVRVPRRGAQDDLLLRGRRPPHSRARRALLAPSSALRHELPARRHGRRDLRLRPARPPGLVLAAGLADPRHPADRRASPTRSSSGRAATAASAGCGRSCGPA